MSAPRPSVSVVVASYRRPALLDACLASVLEQAEEGAVAQVVVAVHEEDEATARAAGAWAARDGRVELAWTRRASRSAARNDATALCRGDWVYLIDDDATLLPGAFAALQGALARRPAARAVGGPNLLPPGSGPFEAAADAVLSSRLGAGPMAARYAEGGSAGPADERALIACNLALQRAELSRRRFDERLDYGEETLLLAGMRRAGLELVREPGLRVLHRRRGDWAAFAAQAWRSGRGRARQTLALPSSLAPECLLPAGLLPAAAAAPWWPPAAAALAAYGVVVAALGLRALRRGPAAALWALVLAPSAHAAYGLGLCAELAAAARRALLPRGPGAALADFAASDPLGGALRPLFAAYYAAAAAAVRLWAAAAGLPVSSLRARRGWASGAWRPGVSDVDLSAVWTAPDAGSDAAELERWRRGYRRLRAAFPVLGEVVLASEEDWRRYERHGDARANARGEGPLGALRVELDRWSEAAHAHARLSAAVLADAPGARRGGAAAKLFLDAARHCAGGPPPERAAFAATAGPELAARLAAASAGEEDAVRRLAAASAAALESEAARLLGRLPAGPALPDVEPAPPAPKAAEDAGRALERLGRATGTRLAAAVLDGAAGALLADAACGDESAAPGWWGALRELKRRDPAFAGALMPLGPLSLRLLGWSAWGEDPLKALGWRAAGAGGLSGTGLLLSRHAVCVSDPGGVIAAPPRPLAEELMREAAALTLLHWRGREAGPDPASRLDRWTRLYGSWLSLSAWFEAGQARPCFPLEPLALSAAARRPEHGAWLRERVAGAASLEGWEAHRAFLAARLREAGRWT